MQIAMRKTYQYWFLIIISIIFLAQSLNAQVKIKGLILDDSNLPVAGANVYFKDTYDGTSSDAEGKFEIETSETGLQTLVVSFIGFETFEKAINLDKPEKLYDIKLNAGATNIEAVVITAGAFDAGDESKVEVLDPIDIVTVASSAGDVYGALNALPGTQTVGEEGGLFVRGGDKGETATFIDGMLVQRPYTSQMPDLPARGRFSPFLFSGTFFSTGGYSAEYGQAMSSALILKTNALPEESTSSISLMTVGVGLNHTKRWDKSSLSLSLDYTNLSPYFALNKQSTDWIEAPEALGGTFIFRKKAGKSGMIKIFASFSADNSQLNYPLFDSQNNTQKVSLADKNLFINSVYNDMLNDKWMIKAGISVNYDNETIKPLLNEVTTTQKYIQSRLTFTNEISETLKLKIGCEQNIHDYNQDYFENYSETNYNTNFKNSLTALYSEAEWIINKTFAIRAGARGEYAAVNDEFNISPRLSLAQKTGDKAQVSFAYGIFNQMPQNDYIKFNNNLKSEYASHYILNYQYNNKNRTFRAEAFYKSYNNLVKYSKLNSPEKESYNNKGDGYAKGIDLFWRDKKTLKNVDYWISYSFLDTERNYKNYPENAIPEFVSKHNFRVVYKQYVSKINTQIGFTYSYASGRTYFNPNNSKFLSDKTDSYHDLSLNASYITSLFNNFTIVYLSVSNVLGCNQVFGYNYNQTPNESGKYEAQSIKPGAKRFIFLGVFITIE